MSQHSPVPWRRDDKYPSDIIDKHGDPVTCCYIHGVDGGITEANVSLILAAPKMKDMLMECHNAIESSGNDYFAERIRLLIKEATDHESQGCESDAT